MISIARQTLQRLRQQPLLWPALLVLFVFGLRVLSELRSGQWESDADYLMYMADQWLRGNTPWIREFDDKPPFTYVLFLPAALGRSIRIYQLQSSLIVLAGSASTASVFSKVLHANALITIYTAEPASARRRDLCLLDCDPAGICHDD